jgi:hypothetical protein
MRGLWVLSFARAVAGTLLLLGASLAAQVSTAPGESAPDEGKIHQAIPRVPGASRLFSGFNAGVNYAAVHDSTTGWYMVLTPGISYTFSPRYSMDASTPLYLHRMVQNQQPPGPGVPRLVTHAASAGDTLIGFHATFMPGSLLDTMSAYLTAPTGDRSAGVGTGRVTVDFNNHIERYHRTVGGFIDLGIGNSSNVFNSYVNTNYSSVGGLARFQAGAILWLPRHSYFEPVAYEQLPFGSQTVYSSAPTSGTSPQPVSTTSTFAEDNGFVTFAGTPLWRNLSLFGYYNRSLRRSSDTVSFGINWVLHPPRASESLSLIDRALREAEKAAP